MKILAATGSFKDTFSSIESCRMIRDILVERHEVAMAPVCDGGEYTYDILKYYYKDAGEIKVDNVINPYGKPVTSHYLALKGKAFVISSEILHLTPEEEEYKNPLKLTDYGLGQLLRDAVRKGFKDINLCLGGTSTVGFGMGTAQALGAVFTDADGNVLSNPEDGNSHALCPGDYCDISGIKWNKADYRDIKLTVINDGITKASDLDRVNPLKIGTGFGDIKSEIIKGLDKAADKVYELTNLTSEDAYSGNGGGIYYGIERIFDSEYLKGADYFCRLFHLVDMIDKADVVITGEGRYDNPHLEKLPVTVANMAKKLGKRVIYVCGSRDKNDDKTESIDEIISCDDYYRTHDVKRDYESVTEMYRKLTPMIFKERLGEAGL